MYQPMYIDVYIRIKITFLVNFSVTVAQHYLRVPGCPENHLCDVIWTKNLGIYNLGEKLHLH